MEKIDKVIHALEAAHASLREAEDECPYQEDALALRGLARDVHAILKFYKNEKEEIED